MHKPGQAVMKRTRKLVVALLAFFASLGMAAFVLSSWYLWHLASRVPDPSRGLVYPRTLGTTEEFGAQFTVYLSSAQSVLLSPELHLAIFGVALVLLTSVIWWRFPSRSHDA